MLNWAYNIYTKYTFIRMNMYSSLQVSTSMFREFFVVKDERRKRHNKTNSVYKKIKK